MRQNYSCIGGCIDIEGYSLIRFDLVDKQFNLVKTVVEPKPTYDKVLADIGKLTELKTTIEVETIDVLSNFGTSLKNYILQNHTSEHTVRVKTTPVSEQKENMILNLLNIINQNRLIAEENNVLAINALQQIQKIDKRKLKDIYEGNETLNQVLEAILHSVSWLEGQMIKHRMI